MNIQIDRFILWSWVFIFLLWILTGIATKRTEHSRSEGTSRVAVWVVWIAWWTLLSRGFGNEFLSRPFLPMSTSIQYTGLVVTLVGLAFSVWARLYIGRNWSGLIELKEDHQLIRTGPYALVRHPIYSGFMLATLGTAIAYRAVAGLLSFVLIVVAWGYKAKLEERALLEAFGDEYKKYCQRVKRLIPFVW